MPLDNTPWLEPLADEDKAVIDGAITLLREKGWCTHKREDKEGRHCLNGALFARYEEMPSGMEREEHVLQLKRIGLRLHALVAPDQPVDAVLGPFWCTADFNNAQISVEPVIRLLERARDGG